jgi:hypothetical protein
LTAGVGGAGPDGRDAGAVSAGRGAGLAGHWRERSIPPENATRASTPKAPAEAQTSFRRIANRVVTVAPNVLSRGVPTAPRGTAMVMVDSMP